MGIVPLTLALALVPPGPLAGTPLTGNTGLRLVVADDPPFVLDVDTSEVTPLRDVRPLTGRVLWVVPVGGRAAVVVAEPELYAVRGRTPRVAELGAGADAAPDGDGRSAWVKTSASPSQCALRRVRLDGRAVGPRRAFPCASRIDPAGSLGLVVNRIRVIDHTGRTVLRTRWGIVAAAGRTLVLAGPKDQFTLLDAATRTQRRLPWPSMLGGLDAPAVDPHGRLVALAFANPAYRGGQLTDVWLLDTTTARLTHLPGMPAFVSLKQTSMAWTHDGRLVLLGESGGKDVVAVWRPGETRLAVKTVQLPDRSDSGSDTFAPLG